MVRRTFVAALVAGLTALSTAGPAAASGFALSEHGARAQGFAGAFAAVADDPSAMFYNAAGIAFLKGRRAYLGASAVAPRTTFAGTDPFPGAVAERMESSVRLPPAAYYTHQFSERLVLGLAANAPFGVRNRWADPDAYSGRFLSQVADLTVHSVNPTIGWRAADRFAVGAGLDVRWSSITLERRVAGVHPDTGAFLDAAQSRVSAEGDLAFGFNLGVLARPTESLTVGAQYRHAVRHVYDAEAAFAIMPTGLAALDTAIAATIPSRPVAARTAVTFPAVITAGAAYRLGDWVAAVDLDYFRWSSFDRLAIEYEGAPHLREVIPYGYADAFQVRAGAERQLGESWAARAGYAYHRSPAPVESVTPVLPDADRHVLATGGSWARGPWRLDAAGWFTLSPSRSTAGRSRDHYEGTYKSRAVSGALFIGYVF
ncbi:MAG TPA: outer membrane protein transport protein [Vicinamibacteria bacterium]|nr:outer membrane protein transport protein [Vicinamibacteria bacterium]